MVSHCDDDLHPVDYYRSSDSGENIVNFYNSLLNYVKNIIEVKGISHRVREDSPEELARFINYIFIDWSDARIKNINYENWLRENKLLD
jgi:hypothetical protein